MSHTNVHELHSYLFDEAVHPLSFQMNQWLVNSQRFATFTHDTKSKIRKKLRPASDAEQVAGLAFELETVFLLLQEPTLDVIYEPRVSGQARHPDLAVSFKTHTTVMLEVTRLRGMQQDKGAATLEPKRIADVVGGKLSQLMPQHSNVLLIGFPPPLLSEDELRTALLELQRRAERGDDTLFKRARARDRRHFFSYYGRLSEVLVCELPRAKHRPLSVWKNPQAKHPLCQKVCNTLYRSLEGLTPG